MNTLSVNIRYATEADAAALSELGKVTFYDAFAEDNSEQDMQHHLEETYSLEKVTANIQSPDILYLLAEFAGELIGFAKLDLQNRPEALQLKNAIELHQIYVLQKGIGKGIGSALMERCFSEAQDRNTDGIWLGVWEKNLKAIRFYERWGFQTTSSHDFVLGEDVQRDLIMERPF